jgi:4'-phosphopantetheinyl transferase
MLLSSYVRKPPAQIALTYGPHGKPEIADSGVPEGIFFNVSHCRDRVVYAVSRGHRVGIDIEHLRPISNLSAVSRRYFSQREDAALQALPEESRLAAFLRCWTRKESFVKARGEGISGFLREFDVSLAPGQPAQLLNVEGWKLLDLMVGGGYMAAVALETHA